VRGPESLQTKIALTSAGSSSQRCVADNAPAAPRFYPMVLQRFLCETRVAALPEDDDFATESAQGHVDVAVTVEVRRRGVGRKVVEKDHGTAARERAVASMQEGPDQHATSRGETLGTFFLTGAFSVAHEVSGQLEELDQVVVESADSLIVL